MKPTIIAIVVVAVLIGGALLATRHDSTTGGDTVPEVAVNNFSIVDGKQIVAIHAKGGFLPRKSIAKAGLPTILRFDTSGTFDCSSIVLIPKLGIKKSLPPSGVTDIDLGVSKIGVIQGMCGMGMYPFEIDFRDLK